MSLCDLSAVAALDGLKTGHFSAVEYVEELLARARSGPALNAFSSLPGDLILAEAKSSDEFRRNSGSTGLLCGLPIAIKDNINVAHQPTSAGTPGLRNHYPARDAPVVGALRAAGAIVFGRTNMHELAYGLTSNNSAYGPVRNPFDLERVAGGSSGGSAAAVAAHMVPCALGTDTGGSVRVPAAFCGLVGFRPTHGRYCGKGIVPISHSRDTVGPITRNVEDIILLDQVLSGQRYIAPATLLKDLRIGVPRTYFFSDSSPEVAKIIEDALAQLQTLGVILIEADIEGLADCNPQVGRPISSGEVLSDLPAYLKEFAPGIAIEDVVGQVASPDVGEIIERQFDPQNRQQILAAYELAISSSRPKLAQNYAQYFIDHQLDAIALPTALVAAPPIGEDETIELNGRRVPTAPTLVHNTGPSSIIGLPGLTLPVGMSASGLPVGLELDAPAGHDIQLLSIGLAVEKYFSPPA
jgi:indoleacetamide hydrolase